MRNLDFSSWQSILLTLTGLTFVTLISIGVRLVMMMTVQQRRERMNRQINERLKTLIAAYKTLGGSFTGTLTVDPTHLRTIREYGNGSEGLVESSADSIGEIGVGSDRRRRIRDAVEAALSDIILLGTEEHVRLAGHAIDELVAGRLVHTHELVVSLRNYIRKALDIEPMPADLVLPRQGPARPAGTPAKGKGDRDADDTKGKTAGTGGGANGGAGMPAPNFGGETRTDEGDHSATSHKS